MGLSVKLEVNGICLQVAGGIVDEHMFPCSLSMYKCIHLMNIISRGFET